MLLIRRHLNLIDLDCFHSFTIANITNQENDETESKNNHQGHDIPQANV